MNEEIANNYLNWISKHYNQLKNKYWKFCQEKQYTWSEDIYSDTILKVYESIVKRGLKDTTDYGMESYTFMAFKNNIMNEQRYSRNKKRDFNISSDNIEALYEEFYNRTENPAMIKIISDLFKDFSILYIMSKVEDNFDDEHFYLFKVKTLVPEMTFKKLAETTKIKASRKKVIEVMRWVKENIKKEEIRKIFYNIYGDII
jgi:DNA-directed RNA polymerase specialized sigma24 family protein